MQSCSVNATSSTGRRLRLTFRTLQSNVFGHPYTYDISYKCVRACNENACIHIATLSAMCMQVHFFCMTNAPVRYAGSNSVCEARLFDVFSWFLFIFVIGRNVGCVYSKIASRKMLKIIFKKSFCCIIYVMNRVVDGT